MCEKGNEGKDKNISRVEGGKPVRTSLTLLLNNVLQSHTMLSSKGG